ncbi:hypothetical protein FRC17_010315 [Serendipita sp. 399]|nr:hypothetical protein FRC17_010315 [Serendipita sp. 399]
MAEPPVTLTANSASSPAEATPATTLTNTTTPPATTDLSPDELHLQSIFPDLDAATIHDCYVLCGRNVERTVEFLLGTDNNDRPSTAHESFLIIKISSHDSQPRGTLVGHRNTSTDSLSETHLFQTQDELDEQLARHLEQEELASAAAEAAWQTRQTDRALPHTSPAPNPPPPSGHQTQQTGSGMEDFNLPEQITKLAETGKRTFNTIFNKVRDKLKEFDAAPGENAAGSSSYQQNYQQRPQYGQQQQQPSQPQYFAPEPSIPQTQRQAATFTTPYQDMFVPVPSSTSTTSATAASSANAATTPPASSNTINTSRTAFLPKNPTPVAEKPKPRSEEGGQ